jgi:hypothetical protein
MEVKVLIGTYSRLRRRRGGRRGSLRMHDKEN